MGDDLPPPPPKFAEHFSHPMYESMSGDLTPFGSDEGFEMLFDWAERDQLGPNTTVADLLVDDGFDLVVSNLDVPEEPGIPGPGGQIDAATIVVGAGFTLLRLAGHIDEPGRRLTLKALDVLIRFYGSLPELIRQRNDLETWTG